MQIGWIRLPQKHIVNTAYLLFTQMTQKYFVVEEAVELFGASLLNDIILVTIFNSNLHISFRLQATYHYRMGVKDNA